MENVEIMYWEMSFTGWQVCLKAFFLCNGDILKILSVLNKADRL